MSLVFNITADNVSSDFIANTPDKVSVIPQFARPESFLKLWELLKYFSYRDAFHYLHYLSRRVPGRSFGKYVNMIGHYFHGIYTKIKLFSDMLKDLLQVRRYLMVKDLLPVLRYPYQMVFQIIDGVFGSSYCHDVSYNSNSPIKARAGLALRRAAFIPPASWRVFSGISL
jgi:hypothetical protein